MRRLRRDGVGLASLPPALVLLAAAAGLVVLARDDEPGGEGSGGRRAARAPRPVPASPAPALASAAAWDEGSERAAWAEGGERTTAASGPASKVARAPGATVVGADHRPPSRPARRPSARSLTAPRAATSTGSWGAGAQPLADGSAAAPLAAGQLGTEAPSSPEEQARLNRGLLDVAQDPRRPLDQRLGALRRVWLPPDDQGQGGDVVARLASIEADAGQPPALRDLAALRLRAHRWRASGR